jgi:tetratricopeptide (TPR) repeat protein
MVGFLIIIFSYRYIGLGVIMTQGGYDDQAFEYLNRALQLDEDCLDALGHRGLLHYNMGRLLASQEDLLRVIDLDPYNQPSMSLLASIHESLGK